MLRRILFPLLIVAALIAAAEGTATACPPRVHRVTLPAVHVVQPYCIPGDVVWGHAVYPQIAHVTFDNIGAYASPRGPEWIRYTIEAHTVSRDYRWHVASPGPGWDRFTRRTATFTFDVQDLPGCAVGPGPQ